MRYIGGKYRIARHIEALVREHRDGRGEYVEPFLGGAATMSKIAPSFPRVRGYDVVPDLVLMWQEALAGWVPPSEVSEGEYQALRHEEPSALRGFVGFGCSFGGKWFGGYARSHNGAAPGYNHSAGSSRSVVKQAKAMRHATISLSDYRDVPVDADCVVYADPPYAGTTGYKGTSFDSDEFWETATKWVRSGAVVLVSEYQAPEGWARVWERPMPNYLRGDAQRPGQRVEAVFAYSGA